MGITTKGRNIIFVVLLAAIAACGHAAELELPPVFADGMVLQREAPVPIWGFADPGTKVTVSFQEQEKEAVTDNNGRWQVTFEPMKALSSGAEMKVASGDASLTVKDILVGEVWICGGQSNMDFSMEHLGKKAKGAQYQPLVDILQKEIKEANDPLFRHFKVEKVPSAFKELTKTPGKWCKAVDGATGGFSATGYYFGRELRRELDVPVGLLACNWGGTRVESWMPMSSFQRDERLKSFYEPLIDRVRKKLETWDQAKAEEAFKKKLASWEEKVKEAKASKKKAPRKPRMPQSPDKSAGTPGALFNGMMSTLVPYAVKGAIWYQGESNANAATANEYNLRFSTMIEEWRRLWAQDRYFFIWCQLAAFKGPHKKPVDEDFWATVCDHQRKTLSLPDTGMAVLNDIGQSNDIHPKNKMDAGKRLSLWALNKAYGRDLLPSGPLYKSSKIEGSKIIITFDHAGSGLMTGNKPIVGPTKEVDEPLKHFQICGSDRQWKWADAKITGKDTVEVFHADIAEPVEVRYAWAANPEGANLYNKEGLPASCFATK